MLSFRSCCLIFLLFSISACRHEIPGNPSGPGGGGGGTGNAVCFSQEILPIFQSNCSRSGCHNATTAADGYVLDSYANIIRRGIVPGNAGQSKIYEAITDNGPDRMPPAPFSSLTAAQKSLIAQWINEGARNEANCTTGCDSSVFTYGSAVLPILQNHCLGCHTGAAPSGAGINLSTYAGLKQQVDNGKLMPSINHAGSYPMPKNQAKLSDCKIAVIRKWVEAGAPNN